MNLVQISFWAICCFLMSCNSGGKKQSAHYLNQFGCCAPEILDTSWYSSGKKAPLFPGLEGIHFPVKTENPEAQKYFNQGLMLSFAFNHAEAARSFYEATRQDPKCAICWWGFAYVLGPNYNAGMEPDNLIRAFNAVRKAKELSNEKHGIEWDLISALEKRYTLDSGISRFELDSSYANAMQIVYKKYPENVHIATLYAESLMDMHPWNIWTKKGDPQPWTMEILTVLEHALKLDPRHAGANHFYIHAQEMSKHPESALVSANLLKTLVPGSGHLVHMPSHIFIRTGNYHEGVISNQKAVLVDSHYVDLCHAQGVYPLAYYPHNHHFIAACATLSGESKIAMLGAYATAGHAHKKLMDKSEWATLQHYSVVPLYVATKLGLWNEISKIKQPETHLIYPNVIWNYAMGIRALAKSDSKSAKNHLQKIKILMKDTSLKELSIWGINSLFDLCQISYYVLEGEIRLFENQVQASVQSFKSAVKIEDALNYNEPPDWFFSVRHHLGIALIKQGLYKEAEEVYLSDLITYPENGWALKGLINVYKKTNDLTRLRDIEKRFKSAWKFADLKINQSRIL